MKLIKPVSTLLILIPSIAYIPILIEIIKGFHIGGLNIIFLFISSAIKPSLNQEVVKSALEGLQITIAIALILVFLSLAILLESFILSLVIMIAVPLATVGGFIGLKILNFFTYQALDMLTLLGFLILIGIVVNNSILLVLQTVDSIKKGMSKKILFLSQQEQG